MEIDLIQFPTASIHFRSSIKVGGDFINVFTIVVLLITILTHVTFN